MEKDVKEQKRILRVIEYTGTDEFLRACIVDREIKGTCRMLNGTIREAIIGDWPEVLAVDKKHPEFPEAE